jgi:importin subunit beta-1
MVCQATTAQDVRIRIGAFSCLHEIAAGYYAKLPPYMPEIFNISVKAINGDEEDVALQVCWAGLGWAAHRGHGCMYADGD